MKLVCWALKVITLGRYGHRWIIVCYDPLKMICTRCHIKDPPSEKEWRRWRRNR